MAEQPANQPSEQPVFHVEKLYVKDISFESPHTPEIFASKTEPTVEFSLETAASQKGPDHFEVTLHVVANVKDGEKNLFLVDITYAGLFQLRNIPKEHMGPTLGIECPHILFPYVRRLVSDLVTEGGYKPMVLDPINFAALYQQTRAREAAAQTHDEGGEAPVTLQ